MLRLYVVDVFEVIKLSSVEEFEYRGSNIHQDGPCHREVEIRINEGIKVISALIPF